MAANKIPQSQWLKMYAFLKSHPDVSTKNQESCRQFIEGVLWILRTGAQWRELPARYGSWNSVYRRFARWEERGIWAEMHAAFAQDPDMERVLLDSTVVRAHMCAAGGSKKTAASLNRHEGGAVVDSVPRFTSLLMHGVTHCVSS